MVWVSQVLSEIGDWAARVALAVLVQQRTGSAALTGLVTTISVLPYVGLGPLLSTLGDRLPRRRLMVVTDLARGGLFAAMVLPVPIWTLFVLTFLAACLTPPFESARAALTPLTVPRNVYGDAIALSQLTFEGALFIGYATGGGLTALIGAKGALLVNAGSFVASALVLSRLRVGIQPASTAERPPRVRDGLRAVLDEPFVRRFLTSYTVAGACAIVGEALVAVYVVEELHAGPGIVGLLAAMVPLGVIATAFFLPNRDDDTAAMRLAATVALGGSVVAIAAFSVELDLPWAVAPFLALGAVFASRIPANKVAGLRIPDGVRASAFGILNGAMVGAQGLAAVLGGLLAESIGVRQACVVFLAVGAIVSLGAVILPPHPRPRHARLPGRSNGPRGGHEQLPAISDAKVTSG